MIKCAFLTMEDEAGYVIDDEHAYGPLADLGWQVSAVSWRQKEIPWNEFDAVIIRSTWDYPPFLPEFLAVLEDIDRQTRLANSLDIVRWNLNKTYLRDLEGSGIGIVPTLWGDGLDETTLHQSFEKLDSDEMVIKPVVGANGQDAYRLSRPIGPELSKHLVQTFHNRAFMIQPFMRNVIEEGEFSLFFFNGSYSHAILKTPSQSEFRSQEEHGATIKLTRPAGLLMQRGVQALECISPVPLYARIDFVRDERNDFRVMEMELIEPSMYLRMHPAAPERFARALDQWFGRKPLSG